jgi:hypothetical protein
MAGRFSLLSSLFSFRNVLRRDRNSIKRRQKKFFRDAVLDLLEERQLLATFSFDSGTGILSVISDASNEQLFFYSNTNNNNYTLTTSGTFSGSAVPVSLSAAVPAIF